VKGLLKACERADWGQVVLNGGPPCFHLDGDKFCLRAERWFGHPSDHGFISLLELIGRLVEGQTPNVARSEPVQAETRGKAKS